ncbi:Hypothetical protein SRAE_1000144900 [Strongyloides ratti]|uniref:Abnormal cell migration protein 18-like fibronectin type I domain-containing protein n=1 Tax=Strongyloides ratti TaxID=34506 RepID=A0A090L0B9_STRRB|nr:Hypothetical protein SRAE_1000144900 [Strongyloides ratti]CEF63185.1 Hypothetical protein SRAE_1000144900 [Strongyloides ratti]
MKIFLFFFLLLTSILYVYGCQHGGNIYKNGEEWKEKAAFVMKCSISEDGSWRTEVTACLTPSGEKIPINGSVDIGNDQWNCTLDSSGLVTLKQGVNANAKCEGGYSPGEKWISKSFEFECLPGGGQKLISCVHEDGTKIGVNKTASIKSMQIECLHFRNGTVLMKSSRGTAPANLNSNSGSSVHKVHPQNSPDEGNIVVHCVDDREQIHKVGDIWIENELFKRKCVANGISEIIGCVSKEGHDIPLNQEVVHKNMKYKCEKTEGGAIRFKAGPAKK